MTVQEYSNLIVGINRIANEVFHNYSAFNAILYNDNFNVENPVPIAILMLLKNHYQVYTIELSKIILSGENHFLLNKALNGIALNEKYSKSAREHKKLLNSKSKSINKIRSARNMVFAHLDQTYYEFKNKLTEKESDELHLAVKNVIDFLNSTIQLPKEYDYRHMPNTDIKEFYDLVFSEIINSNKVNSINCESAQILYKK